MMTLKLFPKSDTEYVKKNGKLIVGITDYEPMDYKDENGEWTGFDAEFARIRVSGSGHRQQAGVVGSDHFQDFEVGKPFL